MPSISRVVLVVGLLVFTVGVASCGFGLVWRAMDPCETSYAVSITELSENETAYPSAEHVDYENLSASQQQVFREILTAEDTPRYQNSSYLDGLDGKVVTYRGERYETSLSVADCAQQWANYIVLGAIVAVVGGVVVVAAFGWRLLRRLVSGT